MINFLKVIVVLITATLVTACASSARVQSGYEKGVDFSQYQTFGFSSATAIENPDFPGLLGLTFSAAIEQQMLSRAYVKSDNPDILIDVSVDLESISRPPTNNNCPSYADYLNRYNKTGWIGTSYGSPTYCTYFEGTIEVEMVDVKLSRTIWEGVSRVRIDEREQRNASLSRNVMGDVYIMFEESPLRARQQAALSANQYHPL